MDRRGTRTRRDHGLRKSAPTPPTLIHTLKRRPKHRVLEIIKLVTDLVEVIPVDRLGEVEEDLEDLGAEVDVFVRQRPRSSPVIAAAAAARRVIAAKRKVEHLDEVREAVKLVEQLRPAQMTDRGRTSQPSSSSSYVPFSGVREAAAF